MRRKGTTAVFLPYYLILMGDNIKVFHQTLLFLFWTFLRVEYWSNARAFLESVHQLRGVSYAADHSMFFPR